MVNSCSIEKLVERPSGSLSYLGEKQPQLDVSPEEQLGKKRSPTIEQAEVTNQPLVQKPNEGSRKQVGGKQPTKKFKRAPKSPFRTKAGYQMNYSGGNECWRCMEAQHDWRNCEKLTKSPRVFCIMCGHQGKSWRECPTAKNKTSKGKHYTPSTDDINLYERLLGLVKR